MKAGSTIGRVLGAAMLCLAAANAARAEGTGGASSSARTGSVPDWNAIMGEQLASSSSTSARAAAARGGDANQARFLTHSVPKRS